MSTPSPGPSAVTPAGTPAGTPADEPVRWGILATGKIAASFARDLALTPGAELVAAGSRSAASADAFVDEHRADHPGLRAHGSYEELVADNAVEVVYVASPHSLHLDHVTMALEAGKHVLCEKPVTLDAASAEEMVRRATHHDRFLMEAMWTACHPVIRALVDGLREGRYGAPRQLHAELGFLVTDGPESRMLDPELGASAVLDMGIYPLTLAHLLLGPPEELRATAVLSERGIDLDTAIVGRYAGGALATMACSMTSFSSRTASLATDRGRIDLADFHHPTAATFTPYDGKAAGSPQPIAGAGATIGAGYGNEALEVGRCIRAGLRESPLVPHAQTIALMRQLDDVRAQVGVTFPGTTP